MSGTIFHPGVSAPMPAAVVRPHFHRFALSFRPAPLGPHGILLPLAFAAVLTSASTVIVAMNAQLLRRASVPPAQVLKTFKMAARS